MTLTNSAATDRPQRKDAARNHALLLTAARTVFAERGLDATLDDIAREAGVGVGTAYRHFANKREVADALFDQAIEQVLADAHRALAIEDPWAGFCAFFEAAAEVQATDRGLHQVLVGSHRIEDSRRIRELLSPPVAELFARAHRAGVLRPDVVADDTGVIFAMLGVVYDMSGSSSPNLWRRYLTVILDGLRATGRPALPAPPLTESELDAAMARVKVRN
jgi:AcrR family transcriptional regulator